MRFGKSVFLLLLVCLTFGCQSLPEVGEPNSIFDGRYSFKHHCRDDAELSSKYDGSNFIISGGRITNDHGGAGRYALDEAARIDARGNLIIEGVRRNSEFVIFGNLLDRNDKYSISSQSKSISGELSGYIRHRKSSHPCIAGFKRIGDAPAPEGPDEQATVRDKITVQVTSMNTQTENDLLSDTGDKVTVDVEIQNLEKISRNGLAIIVPSSTPNMKDEMYYAKKMREFGLATAIINGADPRFSSKFSARYTSSMIVRDMISTLDIVSQKLPEPKQIIVMGSSTGAYGVFKIAWKELRLKYPQLRQIDKAIMINAVCPERFESGWQTDVTIYTANGLEDDSTPAASCEALLKSRNFPNLKRLIYPGSHHFESPRYASKRQVDGMHLIPTCSLNINERLFTTIKRRDGTDSWETEKKGAGEDFYQWLGKTCVRRGHKQGYDPKGGEMFWSDVRLIVNRSNPSPDLQGAIQ